ncbi:putative selenoprotein O-like [Penaeus vannamei]|uniref:Selenoprotein O n=1 Tax=Penaeus vannamei TaxID=6689 RepID=A0A3R7PNI1_PENVA|nr:putative selenoprotein O-like [Penaeus vannamei]
MVHEPETEVTSATTTARPATWLRSLHLFTSCKNGSWWELQLKGSGKTPYSRSGDGRAVIRSSVREFLAAEAMAALGFRTSRSASIVVGEELALRDQFYNGNLKMEKMAVVLRLAPTWFRFGSLEILARRDETEILQLLLDHIIEKHFRNIAVTDPDRYLSLFSKIVEETAEMIAQWQSVGFTHGLPVFVCLFSSRGVNGTPLFLPTWSLSLSCLTGVFRAPPSQMTSGHKLDVNLTVGAGQLSLHLCKWRM